MIDACSGETLTLAEAARVIPKTNGKRINVSTIWRWIRIGIKARSGERTRLDCARVGGRIVVTRDALNNFFNAVAQADANYYHDAPPTPPIKQPTNRQREKSIERAEQTLRSGGIL